VVRPLFRGAAALKPITDTAEEEDSPASRAEQLFVSARRAQRGVGAVPLLRLVPDEDDTED
jgi:hypothetical protein